jgi:hypothetical protein
MIHMTFEMIMPQYRWNRDLSVECLPDIWRIGKYRGEFTRELMLVAILTFMNNHIYLRYKSFREVTYEI